MNRPRIALHLRIEVLGCYLELGRRLPTEPMSPVPPNYGHTGGFTAPVDAWAQREDETSNRIGFTPGSNGGGDGDGGRWPR